MRRLLFTQCLQNDFVAPLPAGAPLPNDLHIGPAQSRRLLGDPEGPWAEEGPLARFLRAFRAGAGESHASIHIRDWHDPHDPATGAHLDHFGRHCVRGTPGAAFVVRLAPRRERGRRRFGGALRLRGHDSRGDASPAGGAARAGRDRRSLDRLQGPVPRLRAAGEAGPARRGGLQCAHRLAQPPRPPAGARPHGRQPRGDGDRHIPEFLAWLGIDSPSVAAIARPCRARPAVELELLREAGLTRPVPAREYRIAQLRYSAHTLRFVECDLRQKRLALASTCLLADRLAGDADRRAEQDERTAR